MGDKIRTKKPHTIRAITKGYLILYNFIQTLGWSYLLYQTISFYLDNRSQATLYETVQWSMIIFQNLAILEVVHAFIRIVPSSPIITLTQVTARVTVVSGVLVVTDLARTSIGLPMILFAWCITEIIRYANYTLNLMNVVPYFLVWLRYSMFVILYPIGAAGELLCVYAAQQEIKETGMWSISMPNRYNVTFSYQYLLIFGMLMYIPAFPQMYLHMFGQRKKVLGKETSESKKKVK